MAAERPTANGAPERLRYPARRRGMDHGRYEWSNLFDRAPIEWPDGGRVALWIVVSAEWFEFDQEQRPLQPLGSPMVEYPDFWGYTLLDYGARAGMRRVMDALAQRAFPVTMAVNAEVCARYPDVIDRARNLGWELIGHGTTSSRVIHDGMPEAEERALIADSLETLRSVADEPVRGWLSPSLSESPRTPDFLSAQGIEYICDWVNDDLPYRFQTDSGPIYSLPYSYEINDLHVIKEFEQTAWDFRDTIVEQFDALDKEARINGGRCMCIALHPWLIGAPHRIRYLAEALDEVGSQAGLWSATGSEILDAFVAQSD